MVYEPLKFVKVRCDRCGLLTTFYRGKELLKSSSGPNNQATLNYMDRCLAVLNSGVLASGEEKTRIRNSVSPPRSREGLSPALIFLLRMPLIPIEQA
jgi:hypothetical protein